MTPMRGSCACTRRSVIAVVAAAMSAAAMSAMASRAKAAAPPEHREFIAAAFRMRDEAVRTGDQAYGAVVVKDGRIIASSPSRVVLKKDWTAHAEREAIREAQGRLGTADLSGCLLYSSSRPCQQCEGAAATAHVSRMFYGPDAADAGSPRGS